MVNFIDMYNYILNKYGSYNIRFGVVIFWYLIMVPMAVYLCYTHPSILTVILVWFVMAFGIVLPIILADDYTCDDYSPSTTGYPEIPGTLNEGDCDMNDNKSILMGRDNPDGYKLEELLNMLVSEVETKNTYIESDPRLEAKQVVCNNKQIIGLLQQAEALQRMSYAVLDNMSANEGPLGKYRIGVQKED